MDKKLSEKQKKFCDYYLELGNATEAYIKAGYNAKGARHNASRLITNDNIKIYIEERTKQMDEDRIAKPQEVLEYLTRVMLGEEPDQFGLDAGLSDRTKAAELLAKRYRLFDIKDNKTLTEAEKEKEQLEIEYKRLQNEKMKTEIERLKNGKGSLNDGELKNMLEGIINEL